MQKPVSLEPIAPPPAAQQVRRGATFAAEGERRSRYHLPDLLDSPSPVGYRTRLALTRDEADVAAQLLSLEPPSRFDAVPPVTEQALFEEAALGVLSARQSTNYRGHRQLTLGPAESAAILPRLAALGEPVLEGAAYTHVALTRPYRTPFTFLLTFIGHKPGLSLFTVPARAWRKRFDHADDIPTIGYLQHLHVGIWADALERAVVLASGGTRAAHVILRPFTDPARADAVRALEEALGLPRGAEGWRIAFVAQVGGHATPIDPRLCRKLGANLLALRSERIQPGVNHEDKAPPAYQARQVMDVSDALTESAGRAAYNAFHRWTGVDRALAKELLLLERIDVLTPHGKERLRAVRRELEEITDRLVHNLPTWADLPTGRALSSNAARGKKAFALAGQRIYVGGLARPEVEAAGLPFLHAVRAFGAAAARSALVAELGGCVDLPESCDLLGGVCLMAGPVNQNDIGKAFYGYPDLLAGAFPGRDPTSLLVWTLKAKTVADPIGNEEQLLNARRKGALVDLRPGPHEVCFLRRSGRDEPMRRRGDRVNAERAFADLGNFVVAPDGREIPGNRGSAWPRAWREEQPWA